MYAPDIGGVETVVAQYAKSLQKLGRVTVVCASRHLCLRTTVEKIDGVRVIRCASLGTFWSMPLSLFFPIWVLLLSLTANVVHFHEPFPLGTLAAILVSFRRTAVTWHSDIVRQKFAGRLFQRIQMAELRTADLVTATSPNLARCSSFLSRLRKPILTLPIWIDADDYPERERLSRLATLPERYLLFLGRLSYYKGVDVLLDAYEGCETAVPLVVIGSGELAPLVATRVRELRERGRQVLFVDRHVSEVEKHSAIAHCECFLFPSTAESEAFGITQLEAMVYGKPVINTSLPTGVPWVSEHERTGLTVEPGDAAGLAAAIDRITTDSGLRRRLSEQCRPRVEQLFERRAVEPLLLGAYSQLLAEHVA